MKTKYNFRNLLNRFKVSSHAKIFACVPVVIVVVALIVIIALGASGGSYTDAIGIGIDFEGGTVLTVTLGEKAVNDFDANRQRITDAIEEFGVEVTYARRQEANTVANSSIEFRYKNISDDDAAINALNEEIRDAVDKLYNSTSITVTIDASAGDEAAVKAALVAIASQAGISGAKAEKVEDNQYVLSYENVAVTEAELDTINQKIVEDIQARYSGATTIINSTNPTITYESIGATAAKDLLSKAAIALVVSVAIILVYIIIRFTLMSGFAAIIALIHDVVIMFALTVICRVQINSSYVAAMITIIAYSINNTIIIFDRCREYVKPLKGKKNIDYVGIGDTAVRETMTRSIYTTLTTMVTVVFLAILGSDSIREFCVPIILGLVAGFYSSVFLATPLWSAMSISFDKTKEKYFKRNAVTYNKSDDDNSEGVEQVNLASSASELKPRSTKQAGQKAKNNTIHKYSKKNTTFKKK